MGHLERYSDELIGLRNVDRGYLKLRCHDVKGRTERRVVTRGDGGEDLRGSDSEHQDRVPTVVTVPS